MHAVSVKYGKKVIEEYMVIVFIVFLVISTIYDLYYKQIPVIVIGGFLFVTGIYRVCSLLQGKSSIEELLLLLIPGATVYLISCCSNGIGNGDGLLFIGTGCYLGGMKNMGMVFLAFFLAAVVSAILLVGKKGMKNRKIPFVPFILAASVIMCV